MTKHPHLTRAAHYSFSRQNLFSPSVWITWPHKESPSLRKLSCLLPSLTLQTYTLCKQSYSWSVPTDGSIYLSTEQCVVILTYRRKQFYLRHTVCIRFFTYSLTNYCNTVVPWCTSLIFFCDRDCYSKYSYVKPILPIYMNENAIIPFRTLKMLQLFCDMVLNRKTVLTDNKYCLKAIQYNVLQ